MKRKKLSGTAIYLVLSLSMLFMPAIAGADVILVGAGDFTGSRVSPTGSGITGTEQYNNGGFMISWVITNEGGSFPFHYTYTVSNGTGGALAKGLSHFLLEVSPNFTLGDISPQLDGIALVSEGPKTFSPADPGNSNPNLPGNIFGIKVLEDAGTGPVVLDFYSTRAPMWGDFYAKDGRSGGQGGGNWVTAWNAGFGTDPTSSTGVFTNWIPVPDTATPIPEPGTMMLLGSGLVGLAGWGRKKLRK